MQLLHKPERTPMSYQITEAQIDCALQLTKNGSTTSIDGCPYELWKVLKAKHETAPNGTEEGFNISKTLATVFQDIQTFGLIADLDFALGWMCPLYKKKDPTEISNYQLITLLNMDYKLFTKVLAIQLTDLIDSLVHKDQAGFIPKRSIFDQIRLAKSIINYAEIAKEEGVIVALDQEKAYDKIRHNYLWKMLEVFRLPPLFIRTVRNLYENASTQVAINSHLSKPF
jgi:Reverse transcriptase (RNA-dependent DNA polymerase)